MPFFSIIIPVYNVAPYLRECLDSVLAQTFTDWEAICVDDGSTDGSGAILDEYAAKDKRFRVIHQKNAGVSVARNVALDSAMGEWLSFVDADDLLLNESIENLLRAANNVNAELAIGCVLRFGEGSEKEIVGPESDGMYSPEDLYVKYNSLCAWSWGKIYKRSLWEKIRFPVGIAYSEDRFVLHQILYCYKTIPVVAKPIYLYRLRDNSAYGSEWTPKRLQRRLAFEEQIRFFKENNYVRAELYTVGLYFEWIRRDICNCVAWKGHDATLLNQIRKEFNSVLKAYWKPFVKMVHGEHWELFLPCGDLRIRIEIALSENGKVSLIKRVMAVLLYDGVGMICRKLMRKVFRG